MSSPNDSERAPWLNYRWLKLTWIFNLARGLEATYRPFDLPEDFATVFRDLKAAIDRQDIDSSPGSGRRITGETKIRVDGLGKFLSSWKSVPEGLRNALSALTDLQNEWAQVQGIDPTKRGRPTLEPQIKAAYDELKAKNKIDFGAPKNRLYEPIRKLVRAKNGSLGRGGLGDEAIRKVISPLFDQDAERNPGPIRSPINYKFTRIL